MFNVSLIKYCKLGVTFLYITGNLCNNRGSHVKKIHPIFVYMHRIVKTENVKKKKKKKNKTRIRFPLPVVLLVLSGVKGDSVVV